MCSKNVFVSLNSLVYRVWVLKQVPVSQENSNLDPQGPVATGNLDLQVRVFAGIPMGKPTGNPYGPAPVSSLIHHSLKCGGGIC